MPRRLSIPLLLATLASAPFALTDLPTRVSAAPVPTHLMPKETSFFPNHVGTKWVYEIERRERTLAITRAEEKGGEQIVTIRSTNGTESEDPLLQKVAVSTKGVFLLKGAPFPFTPDKHCYDKPWRLLGTPHKVGEKWHANLEVEGGGLLTGTKQIAKYETITVPAGEFTAIRVDWEYAIGVGNKRSVMPHWYARGVGLIQVGEPPYAVLKRFARGD